MNSAYDINNLNPDHQPIPDAIEAPSELTSSKAFRDWFQQSKVTTATGFPLMVFHGTARLNRKFGSTRHPDAEGAYFTNSFSDAKDYAEMDGSVEGDQPYVISAFIRLNNPYRMYGVESHEISTQLRDELIAAGYDGVTGADEVTGEIWEYIVFDPSQIAPFHEGVIELPCSPARTRRFVAEAEYSSPAP